MAFRLAEAFFGDAMEPEAEAATEEVQPGEFDPAAYDPEDFDEFVGRYALDPQPDFILTFMREGDTLYTRATGQRRLRIVPTSDSSFALVGVVASVVFHRDQDGRVDGLTLTQNGQVHNGRVIGFYLSNGRTRNVRFERIR